MLPRANDEFDPSNMVLMLLFFAGSTCGVVSFISGALNSLDTVATLGGDAFFNTRFVPLSVKLPPYRPPCRNVAHLFILAAAKVDSRNAFGPMLMYFGSNRLKPFRGISRESGSSIEWVEVLDLFLGNVPHFLSGLLRVLPANVQADDSQ